MLVACSTTWLLVTIRPACPSITTPEPTAWISRSIGPEGMSKNWRKKGSLNNGFCCIATLPVMAMLTTAGAARRTTGARVGSACSDWRGRRVTRAARRASRERMGRGWQRNWARTRQGVRIGQEENMTNVLDAYMVDSDLSFLDKARI